ncbi:Aquaporin-10 [Toxocara canis]|uniref:Aquaporin-10 n=1 Tax=Toxocara canis TaxID=6265 RepID=A0A0B2V071_TOXCA|nr:Aquaporin-10 [Toxocara canis]
MDFIEQLRPILHIRNDIARCTLAEFFCTALLMFAGCCASAQYVLSKKEVNAWIGVNVGWGLALAFAVYGGYNISGSHLNPAVSFFLFTMGRLSALRCAVYSMAQILGAFVGAALTYITYLDAFKNIEGENRTMATAGVFATYPQPYLSVAGGIIDQIVGTAFLCICVCLITDKNNKIPAHLQPLLIGLLVAMIGMSIGMNCGYAINPARDLGPRLLTLCAGWGWQTFSFNGYKWFWIPIVCPMIGAVIGAWIYELCLGIQLVDPNGDSFPSSNKADATNKSNKKETIKTDNKLVLLH